MQGDKNLMCIHERLKQHDKTPYPYLRSVKQDDKRVMCIHQNLMYIPQRLSYVVQSIIQGDKRMIQGVYCFAKAVCSVTSQHVAGIRQCYPIIDACYLLHNGFYPPAGGVVGVTGFVVVVPGADVREIQLNQKNHILIKAILLMLWFSIKS